MLELNLLEKKPQFILDTNSLNKLPLALLDIFSFYCPEGVVEEHKRWISQLEKIPIRIENLEKEIEKILEPVKQTQEYLNLSKIKKSAEYKEINNIVERAFIEQKLAELKDVSVEEWDKQIETEYRKTQNFEREKRNHYLKLTKAILYDILYNDKEIRIEKKDSQPPRPKGRGLRDSGTATQGLTTPLGGEEDADK